MSWPEWMEGPNYIHSLNAHRAVLGVLAIIFNTFLIWTLSKFPYKERSGYYKLMRQLMNYMALYDLLYGLCILGQITVYETAADPLEPAPAAKFFSEKLGWLRKCSVNGFTLTILFISSLRLSFTVFPLRSMVVVCHLPTRTVNFLLGGCSLAILLGNLLNKFTISRCYGLLACEQEESVTFNSTELKVTLSTLKSTFSLSVCCTILLETIVIWRVASRKNKETQFIIGDRNTSTNYKAVQTSLAIASIFLLCNAGAMANNTIKIIYAFFREDPHRHLARAYFIADTFEQWLLPVMTVANCILYTATSKKLRKFSFWYCRNCLHSNMNMGHYAYECELPSTPGSMRLMPSTPGISMRLRQNRRRPRPSQRRASRGSQLRTCNTI